MPAHVADPLSATPWDFLEEHQRGTNPRVGDSDGDGVRDGDDPDPLDPFNPTPVDALPSRGGWRAVLPRPP
jgi:hypothetical protein